MASCMKEDRRVLRKANMDFQWVGRADDITLRWVSGTGVGRGITCFSLDIWIIQYICAFESRLGGALCVTLPFHRMQYNKYTFLSV